MNLFPFSFVASFLSMRAQRAAFVPFTGKRSKALRSSERRPGKYAHLAPRHNCKPGQAAKFAVVSRQIVRRLKFENAMTHINRIAGREPRSIRRSMARALSKRVVVA